MMEHGRYGSDSQCLYGSDSQCSKSGDQAGFQELCSGIVAGAGRLSAAMCAWLLLIAQFDAQEGYVREGLASTAQWLAFSCGIAKRTAADHVRVARCLAAHDVLAAEMSAGRLSYSQVRAIARVAHDDEPELVAELVEVARYGTVAQLEALVRGLRTVEDVEIGQPAARDDREFVRWRWDDDSRWRLSAALDPERGAVVVTAVETIAATEQVLPAEALVRLAEIGLAALADGACSPRSLRGDEEAAVVIHLDASRLLGASAENDGVAGAQSKRPYARLADGGPGLPDSVVRRLLCAGRVRTVAHDSEGRVLDVGRSHRLVTDKQFRALLMRQQGNCAYPGCPNTKKLHAHHRIHWIDGGRTDLDNLLLLCEPHHLGHHNGQFTIAAAGKGRFTFRRAGGRAVGVGSLAASPDAASGDGATWCEPDGTDLRLGPDLQVAPDAARPLWDGQRLELDYAVSVLADRRSRARESRRWNARERVSRV